MSLKTELQTIAANLGLTFRYGRRYDENINGDNGSYPAMVLLETDEFNFTIQPTSGNIFDSDNVFVQFIDKFEMSQDAEARELTMQAMRSKARQFVNYCANSSTLNIGSTGRGIPVIDTYDVNLIGVEINVNIGLVYPQQECLS